jgi:methionyl-tRNA formyltransferase
MPLRVLFFGTPAFAVPTLAALVESGHRVVGVVSQPDRPRDRGHRLAAPPVKAAAARYALPVVQPDRLSDPSFLGQLAALQPDVAVVAAYGRLLPQSVLDLPRLGFVNVHASLLPRWRGAAPVHRAILADDAETGVTIMRMVLALDAGPILARVATPVGLDETSDDLEGRLATMGAALLGATVDRLAAGPVDEVPQEEGRVTFAPKLTRGDSPVAWAASARTIHNRIRGLRPWPLASASIAGRRVLLRRARFDETIVDAPPGTVLAADRDGLPVAARPGVVWLSEVQPEGRRAMTAGEFMRGARIRAGDRFE